MTVDTATANALVSGLALIVLAWGAVVSARSAAMGPEWALSFLRTSRRVWLVVLVIGVVLVLVEPRWMGPGIAYLALVARWLGGRVAGGLDEALALGPYVLPPPNRRVTTLSRTVLGLVLLAAVFVVAGLLAGRSRLHLMVVAMTGATVLALLAWWLWREGTRIILETGGSGPRRS